MNLKVSFSSNINLDEKFNLKEDLISELLQEIFSYVLESNFLSTVLIVKKIRETAYNEVSFSLYLCDNKEIQKLNSEYRGIDTPTDILSFPMAADNELPALPVLYLGEIIISVDKLLEQAKHNNNSLIEEFTYLTSHGILHLLGVHHESDENYRNVVNFQMEVVEYIRKKFI